MLSDIKSRQRTEENIRQSGLLNTFRMPKNAMRDNFIELGKAVLETPYIWSGSPERIKKLVRNVQGWEHIEHAQAQGKGIIFLTPHMGCFEITSRYYALHAPITVLYRPPKKAWLEPLVNKGRNSANITLAPANLNGVKILMQALKRGEAIGILPDQIPYEGEGEWADFFGKPAYTMTLASKLASKSGATVIMAFGERLPHGAGYAIHLTRLDDHAIDTPAGLNRAIEIQIAQKPEQYFWQYPRHKVSRKTKPLSV